MRFLYQLLLSVSLLIFPVSASQLIPDVKQAVELAEELEHQGDGLYFAVEVFDDLGVSIGHQLGLTDTFALRFEAAYRLQRFQATEGERPFFDGLRRYGVFLDLNLGDTDSFVYVGTAFNQHDLAPGFSVNSGLVWRIKEHFGVNVGHEYRNYADFESYHAPDNTLRVNLVHFFSKRK